MSKAFPYTASVDLLVASPLKRTIYTALLSFPDSRLPLIAIPELQETSDQPCDTGSSVEELQREFPGKNIDFALVVPDWNSKVGRWAPQRQAIENRAHVARQWLMSRPEQNVVVVTHGGILHYLTDDWIGSGNIAGKLVLHMLLIP